LDDFDGLAANRLQEHDFAAIGLGAVRHAA
jgi:hypothetical protein